MRLNDYGPWQFRARWDKWFLVGKWEKVYYTPDEAWNQAKAKEDLQGQCRGERKNPITGKWEYTHWHFPNKIPPGMTPSEWMTNWIMPYSGWYL